MFKIALIAVSAFIAFVTLIALSVGLSILIFYIKHDRCDNGLSMSGAEAAKKILGLYGLDNITVLPSRSLLLGNRYSRRKTVFISESVITEAEALPLLQWVRKKRPLPCSTKREIRRLKNVLGLRPL